MRECCGKVLADGEFGGLQRSVQVHGKGAVSVQFLADIVAAGREIAHGAAQDTFLAFLGRKAGAAEVRHQQGGHTAHVRAGHGGTHPVGAAIGVVQNRAVDTLFAVSTGGCDIHPVPPVGIGCLAARCTVGAYGNDGVIRHQGVIVVVVVAGGKEHHAAFHGRIRQLVAVVVTTGVFDEIVNGCLEFRQVVNGIGTVDGVFFVGLVTVVIQVRGEAPAALHNYGTVVCAVRHGGIVVRQVAVHIRNLAGHYLHAGNTGCSVTAGQARHALSVVADGGDGTRHVRTVTLGGHHGRGVVVEVIASAAVGIAGNEVGRQVLVVHIHAFVHHGDNHLAVAHCEFIPNPLYVDVGLGIAGVYKVPLAAEKGVVECA